MESSNKAIIGVIVITLLTIATTVVVMNAGNGSSDSAADSSTVSTKSDATTTGPSSASFKDGTYTATGSYQTPGGRESIGVTVDLADNIISDATVQQNAISGEAQEFQSAFASGFKSQVVGKKIDQVSLSRVAGSSLTPIGFNNAIDDIENQAKA